MNTDEDYQEPDAASPVRRQSKPQFCGVQVADRCLETNTQQPWFVKN